MKLNLAHVMALDLVVRVHAAKTMILSNALGILALIIIKVCILKEELGTFLLNRFLDVL